MFLVASTYSFSVYLSVLMCSPPLDFGSGGHFLCSKNSLDDREERCQPLGLVVFGVYLCLNGE
nr:MAG TPA: hypothetical protein [Caudoviricetes sp.]